MSLSLTADILAPFTRNIFIETGTYTGGGVITALYVGFKRVYSIENDLTLYSEVKTKFSTHSNVHLLYGDSTQKLSEVLMDIEEPSTIFLDAHSVTYNPLLYELSTIKSFKIKDHIILIDDIVQLGYYWKDITKEMVENAVLNINKKYTISYVDTVNAKNDLLVAQVK